MSVSTACEHSAALPLAGYLKAPQQCPPHKAPSVSDVVWPTKANNGIPWLATVFTAGHSKCEAHSDTLAAGQSRGRVWHVGWAAVTSGVTAPQILHFISPLVSLLVRKQTYPILSAALSDLQERKEDLGIAANSDTSLFSIVCFTIIAKGIAYYCYTSLTLI